VWVNVGDPALQIPNSSAKLAEELSSGSTRVLLLQQRRQGSLEKLKEKVRLFLGTKIVYGVVKLLARET